MKIIEIRRSLEPCTESGWDAVDLLLEEGLTDEDILQFREARGSFLYLKQLRKPFFKLESHDYVIKGVRGDPFFRAAAHREKMEELLEKIRDLAASAEKPCAPRESLSSNKEDL